MCNLLFSGCDLFIQWSRRDQYGNDDDGNYLMIKIKEKEKKKKRKNSYFDSLFLNYGFNIYGEQLAARRGGFCGGLKP